MFTDTNFSKPSPSNASAATLNAWDIPSSRCLFRLRLSELPTEGTESSSSPMMLTPTAVMTCESPERMRERAEKNGYKNGTKYGSLESQIMYGGMLPTPQAGEGEKYRLKYVPGSQMGTSLSAMAASGLLPTPTARDEKNPSSPDGERIQRKLEQGWTIELNDLAAMGTLPGTIDRIMAKGQDGQTSRLSPLFTEEMMGFPFLWTTLPFLRQDGEPKALKPTEMP